jgi:hypothetical protein
MDAFSHSSRKNKGRTLRRSAARLAGDDKTDLHEFALPGLFGACNTNHVKIDYQPISDQGQLQIIFVSFS